MGAIIPIPAGRTSEPLIRQRLLLQLADDQSGLLRLETQISSGQRLILPSDDAPAAMRAVGLKQLLDRKNQVSTNLTTSQSFLAASDAALSQVSSLLLEVRGVGQSVVGTVATNDQRAAAAEQVRAALTQLINTANQQFRGRYLFAGSRSDTQPFASNGGAVEYHGNQGSLQSYADIGLLFPTNADGDAVFGAITTVVEGTVDLNPVLTDATRLVDLNGGQGVHKGKVVVSDGQSKSVVDLSQAETIGDVIDMLQHSPPAGRVITVTLSDNGLNVSIDSGGGGSLTIKDTGGGTTALDLGILREAGTGAAPVIGANVQPRITGATPLDDILGTRARVTIASAGRANDLVIEARRNGEALNGVQVSFINDPSLSPGQESAAYDADEKTLAVRINGGHSTLDDVIAAINPDPVVGAVFKAHAQSHDLGNATDPNSTFVNPAATGVLAGGAGSALDLQSGVQITSGNQTHVIDTSQAVSVEDLLNAFNASPAGVLAEINAQGTGINVRSRRSGVDFSIGENGGQTATQLGIRSFTRETRLEDLNHGAGVHPLGTGHADFIIRRRDGIQLSFDVSQARTIGDVLDLINNHPANQDPNYSVTARLASSGNGIELATTSAANLAPLAVLKSTTSQAAIDLGLIPPGGQSSLPASTTGGLTTLTGRDVNPSEVSGAFTALVRLEQGLRNNDDAEIGRALGVLDDSTGRINMARAELGARQQGLDTLRSGLDGEVTTLKESLSKELDTDLPTAISDLAGRQAAFQAALQTAAALSKLSLLDFL